VNFYTLVRTTANSEWISVFKLCNGNSYVCDRTFLKQYGIHGYKRFKTHLTTNSHNGYMIKQESQGALSRSREKHV